MKLYVWYGAPAAIGGVMAFAVANSVEEAHDLLMEDYGAVPLFPDRFKCPLFDGQEPAVVKEPTAIYLYGDE